MKINKEDYYPVIGEFVMKFGDLETFILSAQLKIIHLHYEDVNIFRKITALIDLDNDRLSSKLMNLRKIVESHVSEENKNLWFNHISEVESLSTFRNTLLHETWYYDFETNKYSKAKNLNFKKEKYITIDDIRAKNKQMNKLIHLSNEFSAFYSELFHPEISYLDMFHLTERLRVK